MKRAWVQVLLVAMLGLSAPAAAWACADGIEVRFSPEKAKQGSVVVVEVRSAARLGGLRGEWSGQAVHFWNGEEPGGLQRALIGVDLSRAPGRARFGLAAERDGRPVRCEAMLLVEKAEFAEERLRVPKRFVELSKEDELRAEWEAKRLQEILAGVTPERLWEGAFVSPVGETKASGNFGKRRILNDEPRSPHAGEDFPAPAGAPVRAAQRGRVALAEDFFFPGRVVVLDHGLGLFTYYAHLERIDVREGEVVEAGAVLGRVGATGRVTGPHLHWAARLGQARVNPMELIAVTSE